MSAEAARFHELLVQLRAVVVRREFADHAEYVRATEVLGPLVFAMAKAMEAGATDGAAASMQLEVARVYRQLATTERTFIAPGEHDHSLQQQHVRRAVRTALEYYGSAARLAERAGSTDAAAAREELAEMAELAHALRVPLP